MKVKKTYSFALKSALVITVITSFFIFLILHVIDTFIIQVLLTSCLILATSFLIIQYRVERFIYQRVKKIYETVSILDIKKLKKIPITSDMASLSKNVEKFAQEKLFEIDTLNKQAVFRREFVGNLAHELKTPLFSVQSYLLTLMDDKQMEQEIKAKYLERTAKNVERLVSIVEDLDFITKLDADMIEINTQEFDIVALVVEVFDMLEINALNNKVNLHFDKVYFQIKVLADKQKIEQVLINLLSNAIKYGRRSSHCTVKLEEFPKEHIVKIHVMDQGEGISKEHLPRLFERFYRVDKGRSRGKGGSGLGLSIVKHIVEIHEGEVGVTSKLNEGSDFWFTLETA